ncbi:ABC transporter permease [Motilibacter deserti]|nr:ABC transporter permease [Motilibacter deserti]
MRTSPVLPALGGFTPTFVLLEARRILRNRRTLVFILVMPAVFFLMFGKGQDQERVGGAAAELYVLVSLAVYAAMVAATSAGASVSVERAQGWSRQLRLTPLRPAAYVAVKAVTALLLALLSVVVELTVGALSGVTMPAHVWLLAGLTAWLGSLVFAELGLLVGLLVPAENVMQLLGPALALLAMFGGLFVPLELLPQLMQDIAHVTPVYGISQIARAPLTGVGPTAAEAANVALWVLVLAAGSARLFRRDTARV